MKESLWGYWLIILGLFVMVVMMLLQNYTTTNEQDYYLIKEVTEAALVDAIDWTHYRKYGEYRIVKEKFVEDFARRFSETVNISKTYKIDFYDIYEAPPKVSVKVTTKTNTYSVMGDTESVDVVNKIDAILESQNLDKIVSSGGSKKTTTTTTTTVKVPVTSPTASAVTSTSTTTKASTSQAKATTTSKVTTTTTLI